MTNSLPSYGAPTSPSLIGKLRNQEEAAWHRLVDCYAPLIGYWANTEGLAAADVEAIVQDVLISVSRGIKKFTFDGQPGSFRRWIRSLTTSRIEDHRRQLLRKRYRDLAVGGSSANQLLHQIPERKNTLVDDGKPKSEADTVVLVQLLKTALKQVRSRLAESSLRIFVRVRVFGCRVSHIAEDEGIAKNSAYRNIARTRKALRKHLPDGLPGFPLLQNKTSVSPPPS